MKPKEGDMHGAKVDMAWAVGGGDKVEDCERLMTKHKQGHMVAWLHGVGLIHDIYSFAWVQWGGMNVVGLS